MEAHEYENMAKNEESHWWFVARRKILSSLISKFSPVKNKRILEIGSGTGGNLKMLLEHGNVTAIEPNAIARNKISAKFGDKVLLINGKLPDSLNIKNQKFDLICLFDVLEHIADDKASLQELRKHLTPQGIIFLTVPAFQFLWSGHDKNLHHFRRYNKNNLSQLIKACDLKIIKISYFNFLLFPLAALTRLFSKSSGDVKLSYFSNSIFRKIFSSEKLLLKSNINLPFGLSLLAIIKPN